jgi:antitoxin VapB
VSLHIENPEVERLVAELVASTGETPDEAILHALQERRERIETSVEERIQRITERLERDVWSKLPPGTRGKPISQAEQDEILGYGPDGYCV